MGNTNKKHAIADKLIFIAFALIIVYLSMVYVFDIREVVVNRLFIGVTAYALLFAGIAARALSKRRNQMNDKETERAKTIALTIYDEIDYSRTHVSYFPEQERPPDAGYSRHDITADIVYKDGYRFAYFPGIDHLLIGEDVNK